MPIPAPAPILVFFSADSEGGAAPISPPAHPATRSGASRQPCLPAKAAIGPQHEHRWCLSNQARPRAPSDPELQLGPKSGRGQSASSGLRHLLLQGVHYCLAPRIPVGYNRDGGAH
ncbi:hypothetical protein NDU88_004983 [Pleurodeles waltl]|uniref:Uncharacterized protein n=1 Tax=Pleurodeles waltl TaxID=8319 RepID=A0AAV7WZV2_PLEWA|nr:hypothetical protein NDU88_004983 [Pleurodeles waltl]